MNTSLRADEAAAVAALVVATSSSRAPSKRWSSGLVDDLMTKGLFGTVDDVINPLFHKLVGGDVGVRKVIEYNSITSAEELIAALESAASDVNPAQRASLWREWAALMSSPKTYNGAASSSSFREVFLASEAMEKSVLTSLKSQTAPGDEFTELLNKCLCTDPTTTSDLVKQMSKVLPITNKWAQYETSGSKEVSVVAGMVFSLLCCSFVLFKIDPEKEKAMAEQHVALRQTRDKVSQLTQEENRMLSAKSPTHMPASSQVLDLVKTQRATLACSAQFKLQSRAIETSQRSVTAKMKHISRVLETNTTQIRAEQDALQKEGQLRTRQYEVGVRKIEAEKERLGVQVGEIHESRQKLLERMRALDAEEGKVKDTLRDARKLGEELAAAHNRFMKEVQNKSQECVQYIRSCETQAAEMTKINVFIRGAHRVGKAVAKGYSDKQCEAMKSACEAFFSYASPHLKSCLEAVVRVKDSIRQCVALLEGGCSDLVEMQTTAAIKCHMRQSADVVKSARAVQREIMVWDTELRGKISGERFTVLADCMFASLSGLERAQRDIREICAEWVPDLFKRKAASSGSSNGSVAADGSPRSVPMTGSLGSLDSCSASPT